MKIFFLLNDIVDVGDLNIWMNEVSKQPRGGGGGGGQQRKGVTAKI